MGITILGMIGHRLQSETIAPADPIFDKDYIASFARAHEEAGFDRILIGYWTDQPDGFLVAAQAGAATSRVQLLLAHRPGFVAPTLAARKFTTLEHLTGGRVGINIISGGSDEDQKKDGDFLSHDERYARTDEFLDVAKKTWTSEEPFNYHGKYYQVEGAFSSIRPLQKPHLPVYFGGLSDAAKRVAGKHADVFMFWGEPLADAAQTVASLKAEAKKHQRDIEFSISFRPILGRTEAEAWEKAEAIRAQTRALLEKESGLQERVANAVPQAVGAARLREFARRGERLDERFWTGIAELVGGTRNSTALVGTPEQVAEAIAKYYDLGINQVLVRGFDPLNDAVEYGRELLPLVRAKAAERDRLRAQAA
ncbi:MAG: LLM class flavin-dependent oxidoreductase [Zoogloeaceae bacterium]|jgi:alkanesulfonate monooxygenase|nr:LLM class flavin-dependent oxidoreductase [Zoogloeaceae bacterium]